MAKPDRSFLVAILPLRPFSLPAEIPGVTFFFARQRAATVLGVDPTAIVLAERRVMEKAQG